MSEVSREDRILKAAKREAYGVCPEHAGHADGDMSSGIWLGFILGLLLCIPVGFIAKEAGYDRGQEAGYSEGTQTVTSYTPPQRYLVANCKQKAGEQSFNIFPDSTWNLTGPEVCSFQ